MRTYNVGVIGSGFMGKAHTYAYKAIPFFYGKLPIAVNLRAICSLPLEAAQEAAQEGVCLLKTMQETPMKKRFLMK